MSTTEESENLTQLKLQKEELELDFKISKEKKENLELEKKKMLKGIKIGNDYLELFNNTTDKFD